MHTLDFALPLGKGKTGNAAKLRAQFYDSTGTDAGAEISTGFVEIGAGNYHWHYAAIPDDFRGGVKFYLSDNPEVLAIAAINPEEGENMDVKFSSLTSSLQALETALQDLDPESLKAALISALKHANFSVKPERTVLSPRIPAKPRKTTCPKVIE
jgi:hypothetical protein